MLLPFAAVAAEDWTTKQVRGRIGVFFRGKLFTNFFFGPEWDKPFVFPLLAADGTELSRGWPVATRAGDQQDHAWHRGLWWGHGDIAGEDFWREKTDPLSGKRSTGRIVTRSVSARVQRWKGAQGSAVVLRARHELLGAAGARMSSLETQWSFRQAGGPASAQRQIDFSLRLEATQKLRFGDTEDGGFAFRLREEFREDRGAELRNAEGLKGAKSIWGKASPWTDYSAVVEGKRWGVAVLGHPTNLRHPSGWHARNYGLNAANPFAESGFAEEKGGQKGAWFLGAGQVLRLRYRVVLHGGDAAEAGIAGEFARFQEEETQ